MDNTSTLPLVSVILPVYNGFPYLDESINSVLKQSFNNYELIIIDDGSTDNSGTIIEKYNDPRIRFFQQSNKGLAATLNRGISLARGEYIARQDQDDVCFPLRFEKQIAFLEDNLAVGLVGTFAEIWDLNERTGRLLKHPTNDAIIKFKLLFNNHFVHSSMMIRRLVFEKVGGYTEDKSRHPPEDYELWSRVMREFKIANLPEVLMAYREVPNSMSRLGLNPFVPNLIKISAENISWASSLAIESPEVIAISKLSQGAYSGISSKVRFSRMKSVLQIAVMRIAYDSGVSAKQLDAALQARLNLLRYHYINYLSGGRLGKMISGRIGQYVKRVVRRMLTVPNT